MSFIFIACLLLMRERLAAAGGKITDIDDALHLRQALGLKGVAIADPQAAGITFDSAHAAVGEDAAPAEDARGFLPLGIERVDPGAELVESRAGKIRRLRDREARVGPGEDRFAVATQLGLRTALDRVAGKNVIDELKGIARVRGAEN